jgi:hypothetical protein
MCLHIQSTPYLCNGTVILKPVYNIREPLLLPLSQNGTMIKFMTGMGEMDQLYNATFNLANIHGTFTGISHQISE